MSPTEIKILLLRKGIKLKDLALEFGCSPSHLSNVVRGTRKSPAIREKLFQVLGSIPDVSIPKGFKNE